MCRLLGYATAGFNLSLNAVLGQDNVEDFRELSEIHNDGWVRAVKKNISEAKRKEAYKQAEEICLAFDLKQCLMELLKTGEDNGYRG